MEETPPPVPPKDIPHHADDSDMDDIIVAPTSGSKRKRDTHDHDKITNTDQRSGRLEVLDPDAHTPKRSRSNLRQSDADVSDDATSGNERNLRRKKKVNNLSHMNLRHAAQKQAQRQTRESKFQEGSLTDKPSAQPPSVFTRMIRTDSGNVRQVDELMEDYHDGVETPRGSVEVAVEKEKEEIASRVSTITAETAKKEEENPSLLFRFGRSLTSGFRPIALWNKLWNETREELLRQNIEAEEKRLAKLKADAEAKYAQMKAAGQFNGQAIGNAPSHSRVSSESSRPRDSAVVLDSACPSVEHKRDVSMTSQLLPPARDDCASHSGSGSEVPETDSKAVKTLRSRFHFKRPSLSNLKYDLKRVKSDFNLAAATNRESSSSLSPVKPEFSEHSALKPSRSRVDLKKTHKLSKRVSDLEAKLSQARRELDVALVEASPMPKLGNKYERFTPQSTLKRPKFIPGKLPTLPSERLLNPEQLGFEDTPEAKSQRPLDLSEMMEVDEVNDNTIKTRSERPYPPRATSLFTFSNDNVEDHIPADTQASNIHDQQAPPVVQPKIDVANDMDPNTIINESTNGAAEPEKAADYSALDAKLKALDANVKVAKKSSKSKKRKSGAEEDGTFKPVEGADDDDDLTEAKDKPKKKRKSIGSKTESNSPQVKRSLRSSGAEKQTSPQSKKSTGGNSKKKTQAEAEVTKEGIRQDAEDMEDGEVKVTEATAGDEELPTNDEATSRTSIDSQGLPLEPVYEEEEETSIVPLKDAPSKPTARATPARYGRPRSNSPNKRVGAVRPGVEETMIVRAAVAAQNHPGRQGRSASPAITTKHVQVELEVANGVTEPSKAGLLDMEITAKDGEDFEWPDDVF